MSEPSGRITKINPNGSFEVTFDEGVTGDAAEATARILSHYDRLLTMLRRLEYSSQGLYTGEHWWNKAYACCPVCGAPELGQNNIPPNSRPGIHDDDCDLAALLRELP